MRDVTLPSGAELKIDLAKFTDSKELYQAVLEEMKSLKIAGEDNIDYNLFKDIFCTGFASKRIEKALEPCLKRAVYNGLQINQDTWESPEARGDYLMVCLEVATENIAPFVKSLYAKYFPQLKELLKTHASRPSTTP